jgi:dTDP-6-deoxy-L-talose 4-dehydrogenase (NAD+)
MKGAVSAGVPRIIGIGTCLEYDLSSGHVSVQTPLKPETPYAAAKAASYLALSQWLPSKGVSFAWCRLFYLYGEGEDQRRLVPYIRSQLEAGRVAQLGSGTQIRDYMNVLEAASTLANIVLGREEGPLNISTGVPTTVRQLATVIAEGYGRTDLLNFDSKLDDPLDPKCVVGIPHDLKP